MTMPLPLSALSATSPLPLYYRVARDLERKITTKQLRPGDALPTELQLCEAYGVSRITVRKAMEDLVAKRLVLRHRGVGSFVSEASYANRLVSHVGSLHDAVSYSEELTFRLLSRNTVAASAEVAAGLGVEPGSEVQKIVRLGTVGDEPVSVTDIYLPPSLAAKLPRQIRASGSIVREIEEKAGEPLVRVEQTVSPEAAPRDVAAWLGIKPRAPILQITRVYYAASGTPVEVAVVRYHPQRYTFKVEVVQSLSA